MTAEQVLMDRVYSSSTLKLLKKGTIYSLRAPLGELPPGDQEILDELQTNYSIHLDEMVCQRSSGDVNRSLLAKGSSINY